jgi:hypothetical protein
MKGRARMIDEDPSMPAWANAPCPHQVRAPRKSAAYQCEDSGEGAGDGGDDADQDEGGEKAQAEGNH